jgi:hypothetical protein
VVFEGVKAKATAKTEAKAPGYAQRARESRLYEGNGKKLKATATSKAAGSRDEAARPALQK